ncbi:MAG: YidC/Oxa1 family insertase periplasmic-domain containing protein [Verrucomicrobia bacterium]|nr:YidC/Oxa1 family insertase periplasmic-domain containing protein [Verrucomicrobiota bacterium]
MEQAKVQQENAEENQRHDTSSRQDQSDGNYTAPNIIDVADGGMRSDVNASPLSAKIPQEVKTYEGLVGDSSSFEFTTLGGAISAVHLEEAERLKKSYDMIFSTNDNGKGIEGNAFSMSFENHDGDPLDNPLPGYDSRAYEIASGDLNSKVTFLNRTGNVEIRREYFREANETYVIRHRTTVINRGDSSLKLDRIRFGIGSAFPIPRKFNFIDQAASYMHVGYFNSGNPQEAGWGCAKCSGRIDGETEEFFQVNEMDDYDRLHEGKKLSEAKWASVNNQFFVSILRPKEEKDAVVRGMPIERSTDGNASNREQGVTGSISIPFGEIPPGESRSVECIYYAGPKDYMILSSLGMEQDKVMQFNPFEWVSGPMNSLLNKLHDILGNFGLAIIFLTILLKLVLWPLTAKATRSQKRMQALQEPMAKLREKHKKDSQKMNQEMMKFYKEQGVNPFAGCWPILVQMPIFLGMFYMLRSAAELYGQSFLWVSDLSEQDNVADIAGFSINALPFVMLATQWFQMKLTPMQLGPDASDSQRINAKMMRMMPFMFLVFLYFFSSALVLYWTVQNTMSIIQTLITKKGKSPKEIETERSILAKDEAKDGQKKPDADFIEEEERQHRQVLGLKLRGKLNKKQIDEIYRRLMEKYHPDKVRNLGAKRQDEAMQKKERLEAAYEFLLKKLANKS